MLMASSSAFRQTTAPTNLHVEQSDCFPFQTRFKAKLAAETRLARTTGSNQQIKFDKVLEQGMSAAVEENVHLLPVRPASKPPKT